MSTPSTSTQIDDVHYPKVCPWSFYGLYRFFLSYYEYTDSGQVCVSDLRLPEQADRCQSRLVDLLDEQQCGYDEQSRSKLLSIYKDRHGLKSHVEAYWLFFYYLVWFAIRNEDDTSKSDRPLLVFIAPVTNHATSTQGTLGVSNPE